ncbi:MAG: hypothetical protein NC430_13180 [bacterium]|nr:hypothetical protein [bacterium]MCM1424512.1 hypothetical protein [bacterium]
MESIDKFSDKVITKGKEVTGKVRDMADIVGLKRQIAASEETIRKNYIELGRLYYEKHGQAPEAEYDTFCWEITDAKEDIAELEEEIKRVKGI